MDQIPLKVLACARQVNTMKSFTPHAMDTCKDVRIFVSRLRRLSQCIKMLEDIVQDYATYFKLDVSSGFQTVQEVIDNMITRLEELTSVVNMIKMKNSDCGTSVTNDINKHRLDISTLSKKISTLNDVVLKLQDNIDLIEKQVEKAELDFGVNNDNKLLSIFKPFLKKSQQSVTVITPMAKTNLTSVLDKFEENID